MSRTEHVPELAGSRPGAAPTGSTEPTGSIEPIGPAEPAVTAEQAALAEPLEPLEQPVSWLDRVL
ncbi:MAG TPA: hypothetical protein VH141_12975, partial [Pseudonocardia sp.]|nr:hypothetical protein [Pseudonocardia sp.]